MKTPPKKSIIIYKYLLLDEISHRVDVLTHRRSSQNRQLSPVTQRRLQGNAEGSTGGHGFSSGDSTLVLNARRVNGRKRGQGQKGEEQQPCFD